MENNIINYNMFGEPVKALTLKDVLLGFGLVFNEQNNTYEILADNENLDEPIEVFVNDEFGISLDKFAITNAISDAIGNEIQFTSTLKNIEIWTKDNLFPGKHIQYNNKEHIVNDLILKLKNPELYENILYDELDANELDYYYEIIEFKISDINNGNINKVLVKREDLLKNI